MGHVLTLCRALRPAVRLAFHCSRLARVHVLEHGCTSRKFWRTSLGTAAGTLRFAVDGDGRTCGAFRSRRRACTHGFNVRDDTSAACSQNTVRGDGELPGDLPAPRHGAGGYVLSMVVSEGEGGLSGGPVLGTGQASLMMEIKRDKSEDSRRRARRCLAPCSGCRRRSC